MNASLRALLTGLIDYAGLFPPASLPLQDAVYNYARYQTEPHAWVLGRFICPASKLEELEEQCARLFSENTRLPLSVLGTGGNTPTSFLTALDNDLRSIQSFLGRHGNRSTIDVLELRLPAGAGVSEAELAGLVQQVPVRLKRQQLEAIQLFIEVPAGDDWRMQVQRLLPALAKLPARDKAGAPIPARAGFKLRCGGLEAAAFPAPTQVAWCLVECRRQQVPFKATAGLHHPVRRYDPELRTHLHGFVNVFAGAALAAANGLGPLVTEQILVDEDASHFGWSDEGLQWRNLKVSTADIVKLRESLLTSFGSCSFEEPRQDLRALDWLTTEKPRVFTK